MENHFCYCNDAKQLKDYHSLYIKEVGVLYNVSQCKLVILVAIWLTYMAFMLFYADYFHKFKNYIPCLKGLNKKMKDHFFTVFKLIMTVDILIGLFKYSTRKIPTRFAWRLCSSSAFDLALLPSVKPSLFPIRIKSRLTNQCASVSQRQ